MIGSLLLIVSCASFATGADIWRFSNCPDTCVCELRESTQLEAHLRTVDCSNRQLNSFPKQLPTDVQVLLLNHNKLRQVSAQIRLWLPELLHLDLSHNRLHRLDFKASNGAFEGLYNLQLLDLSRNQLRSLGNNVFQGLFSLHTLDLSRNAITAIMDDAFQGLGRLETLKLSQNKITFIQHSWWSHIPALYNLHLNGNLLSLVQADSFKPLHNLLSLDLSQNRIFRINEHAFYGLGKLEILHLSNNALLDVPRTALKSLRESLKSVHMDRNPIFKLSTDDFANLPLLKDISLTSMQRLRLVERGVFKNLPELLVLQLHDNPFFAYLDSSAFVNTPELTHLFLHNNNLSVLEPQTLTEGKLEELSFYGNPLACDCNARWLREKLDSLSLVLTEAERMVCAAPELHKFKLFSSLAPADFPAECAPHILHMFDPSNERKLGEDIALDCRAVGVPTPRIAWIAPDGSVLSPEQYHPRRILRNGNTLVLQHVTMEDSGIYTCVAESSAGSAAEQTQLNVSNIDVVLFPTAIAETSATLAWKGSDRARNVFQLRYKEAGTSSPHRYAGTLSPIMKTYPVRGLQANTEYEVCLAFQDGHNLLTHVSCATFRTKSPLHSQQSMERGGNTAAGIALGLITTLLILICLAGFGIRRSRRRAAAYDNLSYAEAGRQGKTPSLLHLSTENVYSPLVGRMVPVSVTCKLEQ